MGHFKFSTGNNALPGADPDHDQHGNLEEFAFLTDPNVAASKYQTGYAVVAPGASKFGEITFPVRKFAPTLAYTVEASESMTSGTWSNLWTSSQGFNASVVTSAVNQSDRTIVTIRDTQPSPPATRRFLRVKLTGP